MALDTTLLMSINATLSNALDLGVASAPLNKAYPLYWPTGTGLSQSDKIFHDTRTVNASTNDDVDLAGVLTDPFGVALTFARIKAMIIARSDPTNPNNLTIGNGSNPFLTWVGAAAHTITIRPGGLFVLAAPDATAYAVTAGTGDILRIANGSGSAVTYDLILVGASA